MSSALEDTSERAESEASSGEPPSDAGDAGSSADSASSSDETSTSPDRKVRSASRGKCHPWQTYPHEPLILPILWSFFVIVRRASGPHYRIRVFSQRSFVDVFLVFICRGSESAINIKAGENTRLTSLDLLQI